MVEFRIPMTPPSFPAFLKFENGSLKSGFDLDMLTPLTFTTSLYDELIESPQRGSLQAIELALSQLQPSIDEDNLEKAIIRLTTEYRGDAYKARLAIRAAQICFPIHYELYGYFAESPADEYRVQDPGDYPEAFQSCTLEDLLKRLFGCYRKDLAKAVVRASEEHLLRAWLHADSMPIDWIIDYLQGSSYDDKSVEFTLNAPAYRAMVKKLKPGDSKRILYDCDPLIEDTVTMWCSNEENTLEPIKAKKIKSIRDLHDRLLTLERKSAYSKYLIPEGVTEALRSIEGILHSEELTAELVLDSSRAADVGAILRNCCGASFNREQGENGSLAFVVLNRESRPHALASFARRSDGMIALRELKANQNTPIPELQAKLIECLSTHNASPAP